MKPPPKEGPFARSLGKFEEMIDKLTSDLHLESGSGDPFAESRKKLEALVELLGSDESIGMSLGQVEDLIAREGFELLQQIKLDYSQAKGAQAEV